MKKENSEDNSILVAMSGGVDSSVAALLLKNAGYHVKSAILRLHDADRSAEDIINGKLPLSIWYAREASRKMRLDFSILDVRDSFREEVIRYYVSSYQNGITPNPCIFCNRHFKFPQMIKAAKERGCAKVAGGFYARVSYEEESGRYQLRKGVDPMQEESYLLYRIPQEDLAHIVLPLGDYTKEEVRKLAKDAGLKNANAPESTGICFLPDGDVQRFLEEELHLEEGFLLPAPACEVPATDTVHAGRVCFVSLAQFPEEPMRLSGKMSLHGKEYPGSARMLKDGTLEMKFDEPAEGAVPGQSLVLYDGDLVVAGGIIQ